MPPDPLTDACLCTHANQTIFNFVAMALLQAILKKWEGLTRSQNIPDTLLQLHLRRICCCICCSCWDNMSLFSSRSYEKNQLYSAKTALVEIGKKTEHKLATLIQVIFRVFASCYFSLPACTPHTINPYMPHQTMLSQTNGIILVCRPKRHVNDMRMPVEAKQHKCLSAAQLNGHCQPRRLKEVFQDGTDVVKLLENMYTTRKLSMMECS